MALSGVHIACGYAGGSGRNGQTLPTTQKPAWSETMAEPGTTAQAAPAVGGQRDGDPMFLIATSLAIFVAVGPNPNAVTGPRIFIAPATVNGVGYLPIFADPGDKVAWVAA